MGRMSWKQATLWDVSAKLNSAMFCAMTCRVLRDKGLNSSLQRFCRVTMKGPEDYRTIRTGPRTSRSGKGQCHVPECQSRLEPSAVRCRPAEAVGVPWTTRWTTLAHDTRPGMQDAGSHR